MSNRRFHLPLKEVSIAVVCLLGLALIVVNKDYNKEPSDLKVVMAQGSGHSAAPSYATNDWVQLPLSDGQNVSYINTHNLKRDGELVSFWQKSLYNASSLQSPASKRTNTLILEAQEYYQADCKNSLIKGPLKGFYWARKRKVVLEPNTHKPLWTFKAKWIEAMNKPEFEILFRICDPGENSLTERLESSPQSHFSLSGI